MQDFKSFAKENKSVEGKGGLYSIIKGVADKFDGKSEGELFKAIIEEAKKGKANGTLTNEEIDKFVSSITPMLDNKKKKILERVIEKIKEV